MQSTTEPNNDPPRDGSQSSLQRSEPQNAGQPKVLLVIGDGAEVMDTLYPFFRLGENYRVVVAGPERRRYHLVIHELANGWDITQERAGYHLESEVAFKEVAAEDYVALVLPGGRAPEYLRYDADLIRITQHFFAADKPVASVCHGIEILATADVLRGRKVTTIPKCRFDATICGAEYLEDPVVRSGNLVCARGKKDMSPWMQQFVAMIEDHLARMKTLEQ
jgi:protease I